ncbi:unnamed protein product [Boreogadus saida]
MNCSRVLPVFGPTPQQPMDLAMQLCLSQTQPLYHLLTMSTLRPLKALREPAKDPQRPDRPGSPFSSLSSSSNSTPSSSPDSSLTWEPRSSLRSCLRRRGGGAVRKRVMFADAWGLALAEVRLFVPEPAQNTVFGTLSRSRHQFKNNQLPCSPLAAKPQVPAAKPQVPAAKPQVPAAKQQVPAAKQQVPAAKQQVPAAKQQVPAAKQQVPAAKAQLPAPSPAPGSPSLNAAAGERRQYQLKLASALPAPDYSSGLKDARVQLESCSVTERGLMGTVRVACSGGGEERAVHVRLTFDSWRSHRDVPCTLLLQNCGNTQTDVFAFHGPLPRALLDPREGVEFCLYVRVQGGGGAKVYWDNNAGKNYRVVCMESEDSKQMHSWTAKPGSALLPTSSSSSPSSSPTLAMKNYINPRSSWSGAAGNWTSFDRPAFHSL